VVGDHDRDNGARRPLDPTGMTATGPAATVDVPPPRDERLSILDLGSNSFHVLVADVDERGSISPVAREREMLHLGAVVERHGGIPDAQRAQAIAVVAHLTHLAQRLGATRRLAVATSALREADNGPSVVAHMEVVADTAIRVIDGQEEARLGFKGLAAAVGAAQDLRLVLDLGGGSLELAIGTGDTVDVAVSLPLGVSRLSNLLDDDPPSKDQVRAVRRLVTDEVTAAMERLERDGADLDQVGDVVAIGGTVRALARVAAAGEDRWWPATVNLLPLHRTVVKDLRKSLSRMTTAERKEVPGMKSKRADRIHVAAIVVDATMATLGIDHLRVSDWGLREGMLLETCDITAPPLDELQRREVVRMQAIVAPERPHLDHVAMLAGQLFDQTRQLHGLDDAHRVLLQHGAGLHGVGRSLALRKQHHHGAYLIEHFELRGFTPLETAQLCCLARFHASSGMSKSYVPWAAMGEQAAADTARMVALLQVADALDRARDQSVTGVVVEVDGDRVAIVVDGAQLRVAVPEVQRRTAWFERVMGVQVVVRADRRSVG